MRKIRTAILAGALAAIAAGTAMAASRDAHVMNVALPDGTIARIAYRGDVPPKLVLAPVPVAMPIGFDDPAESPFAMFDRIAADMDRQADTMLRQVSAMHAQAVAGAPALTAFGQMPAGTVHYSFVSTSTADGTCSQSVQVTSYTPGETPKVVRSSSGDCRAMSGAPTPVVQDARPDVAPVIPVSLPKPAAKDAPAPRATI